MTDRTRYRYVIANDLSPSATAAMKRNVDINGLTTPHEGSAPDDDVTTAKGVIPKLGKVRINEGDAWWVSYPLFRLSNV